MGCLKEKKKWHPLSIISCTVDRVLGVGPRAAFMRHVSFFVKCFLHPVQGSALVVGTPWRNRRCGRRHKPALSRKMITVWNMLFFEFDFGRANTSCLPVFPSSAIFARSPPLIILVATQTSEQTLLCSRCWNPCTTANPGRG